MNKTFIWIGIFIVIIVGVIVWGTMGGTPSYDYKLGVIDASDHVKGNASSTVVLTEYSDFQCPACRTYYPVVREVMQEFGSQIALIYRHFPLTSIHANAEFAARAAEAAGKQGKFWEMHDLLFEKQTEWASQANITELESMFATYAGLAGVQSIDQFKSDWRSQGVKDFVRDQMSHAIKSGLGGTPTFFINDKQIQNPSSPEEFKSLIRAALSQKQ